MTMLVQHVTAILISKAVQRKFQIRRKYGDACVRLPLDRLKSVNCALNDATLSGSSITSIPLEGGRSLHPVINGGGTKNQWMY